MSITRRFQSGWELQTTDELTGVSGAAVSNTQAKSDTYSLRISGTQYAYVDVTATAQMRVAMHIYHAGATSDASTAIVTFRDGTNRVLQLRYNEATGNIEVWDDAGAIATGAAGDFAVEGVWNHISFDFKIDAAGWASVRVNGTQVINFSGDTNDGGATVDEVRFGYNGEAGVTWANYAYYDDVYIDDTAGEGAASTPPDYRYHILTPNGNGASSDWDGSDGNQVDNYLLVDDIPKDDDTSYITTDVDGEKDYSTLTTYALGAGESFVSVIAYGYMRKEDGASAAQVKLNLHDGVNESAGTLQDLSTSYTLKSERFVLAPDGGAWAQGDVDALQVGVEVNI